MISIAIGLLDLPWVDIIYRQRNSLIMASYVMPNGALTTWYQCVIYTTLLGGDVTACTSRVLQPPMRAQVRCVGIALSLYACMQAASSICTVRRQFLQAQWTLVKVFRYKNSSFDLTYHFDCLLDNSFTNSPGIHQATMFFFVGPQGQYLMWFTGPYRFLLASGQRASVSVEPCNW